jgi:hypothetical protein
MTIYLVISMLKIPYVNRIYMVPAKPTSMLQFYAMQLAWQDVCRVLGRNIPRPVHASSVAIHSLARMPKPKYGTCS